MLTFGIYKFELTLNLITLSKSLFSSESIRVKIVRTPSIIVNLIEFRTSEITLGQNQELLLEPGKYSVDEDGNKLIEDVCIRKKFNLFCFIFVY
jgi:hypothetical protein